jgi:hypothetical protein
MAASEGAALLTFVQSAGACTMSKLSGRRMRRVWKFKPIHSEQTARDRAHDPGCGWCGCTSRQTSW